MKKQMFEEYLHKAEKKRLKKYDKYDENLALAMLDKETAMFAIETLLNRIKQKLEDSSVYKHLKETIKKWNLYDYAKQKIEELKLNPKIKKLLGL